MTGRKGRVLAKPDGSYVYEPRAKDDVPLEVLNVAEKKRFMNAEKVCFISSKICKIANPQNVLRLKIRKSKLGLFCSTKPRFAISK